MKKRLVSLLLVLCLACGCIPMAPFAAGSTPFTDVPVNAWYTDPVQYVYDNGIMSGTTATTFGPKLATTRGMVVTVLHRMEGEPAASASTFDDVPSGKWFSEAVAWANENDIVKGYSYWEFGPHDMVTREQLATIIYRYAAYKWYDTTTVGNLAQFSDNSKISGWARTALSWANGVGLINGKGNNRVDPKGSATRAELAAILERFERNISGEGNQGANTSYQYKISTDNHTSIVVGNVLYYCDASGVWKKETGKEKQQLSKNRGDSISTNGETILYSQTSDGNNEQGSIRSVNTDGSNDYEICKTARNPEVLLIFGDKLFYTAYDTASRCCLFSYNMTSGETKTEAIDVFLCSIPVDGKIVYLDGGGSEFSIYVNLHLLDLSSGKDRLIDSSSYGRRLYQENDVVYSIKQTTGSNVTSTLCAYNLKTNEQTELCSFFTDSSDKGVYPLGVHDGSFFYCVAEYGTSNAYSYYKYSISSNTTTHLNGLPNELCYFVQSSNGMLCVFNYTTIYLYSNGQFNLIKNLNEEIQSVVECFDKHVYYIDNNDIVRSSEIEATTESYLSDYLNKSTAELKAYLGNGYESTNIPGSGLSNCISFNSLPNVAFGMSSDTGKAILLQMTNSYQILELTEGIKSDMTGSELLSLNGNNYTVSEHYSPMSNSQVVSLKYVDGLVIVFEWGKSNYKNSPADSVSMQYITN